MSLILLGSLTAAVVSELERVRKKETMTGFPQFVVLPDGSSPPSLHLYDMPIEPKVSLELSLLPDRLGVPLGISSPESFALIELPRRVLRGRPGDPFEYVFDRGSR